jgi:hypothetical protein
VNELPETRHLALDGTLITWAGFVVLKGLPTLITLITLLLVVLRAMIAWREWKRG